ncbi:DUF6323 family protein [[Clostridium] polysaccharolyticum]|uniref:Uncharacterized protein n=1 Tax=[Clostridium] polysaccharolyticum TaxID=29364 RepID=A0A1H9ZVC2_9FIRM|nr:DUF6323 family protein [[Clostridium] polysaccharolyticum]SES85719.1 hypothetical protein SAMN04487772_104134 [[Clostridium] polysaccharolyticum]
MEKDPFWELQNKSQMLRSRLEACNDYTRKFGIEITQEEASLLLEERKRTLKEQERIEFGEGILTKLIYTFCDSPYIYQDNYVEYITKLQEIFYLYKNESLDDVSDDELLDIMKEYFDGDCQGSLDYLEETCLEAFARSVRMRTTRFIGKQRNEEEDAF